MLYCQISFFRELDSGNVQFFKNYSYNYFACCNDLFPQETLVVKIMMDFSITMLYYIKKDI